LDEGVGAMDFVRMKDGRWAIMRWSIQMPVMLLGYSSGTESRVAEYRVAGGELSLALRGTDTLFKRPPLILSGYVVDSLTGAGIPRARLSLAGTTVGAESDVSGVFVIGDVLPGEYTLEVRTPSLDSVTAVSQTFVTVTKSVTDLHIKIPTGQQIAGSLCGSARLEAQGIVLGTVAMRGDTLVPDGIRVTAEWQQPFIKVEGGNTVVGKRSKWAEARADSRGRYRVCGVPVNFKFTMRAESDSASVVDTRLLNGSAAGRRDPAARPQPSRDHERKGRVPHGGRPDWHSQRGSASQGLHAGQCRDSVRGESDTAAQNRDAAGRAGGASPDRERAQLDREF
jgi:hypothetical protein